MKRLFIIYDNSSPDFDPKQPEGADEICRTRCLITANNKHSELGGALYRYEYGKDGTLRRKILIINSKLKSPSRPKRREGPERIP